MSNIETKGKNAEASLLCDIYRNAKMGAEAILDLMPKTEDERLREELTKRLAEYDGFAKDSREALEAMGEEPLKEGAMSKMMAKMGIKMNTLLDNTSSHIAQMISEGCVMGTTDLQKRLNEGLDYGEAEVMAKRLISAYEDTVERMKAYL